MLHSQPRSILTNAPSGEEALPAPGRLLARNLRRRAVAPLEVGLAAAAVDAGLAALAIWVAAVIAAGSLPAPVAVAQALLAGAATAMVVHLTGGYQLRRLRRLWPGAAVALAAGTAAGLLLGPGGAGAAVLVPCLAAALLSGRLVMRMLAGWALDYGLTERRAVVIGGGAPAARLVEGLAANPANDIRICAIFDDRGDDRSPPVVLAIPKIGTTQDLLPFAREAEIDMVIVALPLSAEARIREILRPLTVLPLDIRLSAYSADMAFPRRGGRRPGDPALLSLALRPLEDWDLLLKRALDLVGGLVALAIFALPMLAIALAIRLESRGPVFFRQQRHGYNHRPITVWKFRSMRAGDCDPAARQVVVRGDPRVTRVGRIIRRLSLDELPQIFNVLRGELSLVGPRPHALVALSSRQVAFAEMVEGYAARHRMRPGLTGWAQVNGWRGEIDDPEKLRRRFEHDLFYIENWSIWLDLRILFMTPMRMVEGENAY